MSNIGDANKIIATVSGFLSMGKETLGSWLRLIIAKWLLLTWIAIVEPPIIFNPILTPICSLKMMVRNKKKGQARLHDKEILLLGHIWEY